MVALIASQAARMLVNDMAELGLVLGADLSVERGRWNPVPWARFLSTKRRSKGVRVIMKAGADSHDSHSHFHHKNNRVSLCLSGPASFAISTCLGWSFHVVGAERTQKAPQRMRKRSNTDKMRRTTQRRNSHLVKIQRQTNRPNPKIMCEFFAIRTHTRKVSCPFSTFGASTPKQLLSISTLRSPSATKRHFELTTLPPSSGVRSKCPAHALIGDDTTRNKSNSFSPPQALISAYRSTSFLANRKSSSVLPNFVFPPLLRLCLSDAGARPHVLAYGATSST